MTKKKSDLPTALMKRKRMTKFFFSFLSILVTLEFPVIGRGRWGEGG